MDNEKKLRLIQVAKEFKVGLNTIVDFLHKKGVAIDSSPNTQVSSETYAIIEKEYGSNRSTQNARDNVRMKIATRPVSVSIEEEEKPKETPVKESTKEEIAQPRILGKIDIDKSGNVVKPKAEPKVEPKAEPKVSAVYS